MIRRLGIDILQISPNYYINHAITVTVTAATAGGGGATITTNTITATVLLITLLTSHCL